MMWNLHKTKSALRLSLFSAITLLNGISLGYLEGALVWSSPIDLSAAGKNAVSPQVSINPAGHSVVVWSRSNGSNFIVETTQSKLGRQWSTPQSLSQGGQNAFFAKIANDKANNSVAVWTRSNGTSAVVQAVYRNGSNNWSDPVALSIPVRNGQNAATPQVAIDKNRNVTVVWSKHNGINNIIQSSIKKVGQGWSTPEKITVASSEGLGDIQPSVIADGRGSAYAAWVHDATSTIQGAMKLSNGHWSAPVNISASGQRVSPPQLVVDGREQVSAVWSRNDGYNDIVQTVSRRANGDMQAVVDLSEPGQNALNPQIAVDDEGNKIVVWQRSDGINSIIQATIQFVGGDWLSPVDLSNSGQDASDPQVAVDDAGNIVVVWKRSDGETFVIEATTAKFLSTSVWATPVTLSDSGEDAVSPQLAMDHSGRCIVVWQRSNGANSIIQAAVGMNPSPRNEH